MARAIRLRSPRSFETSRRLDHRTGSALRWQSKLREVDPNVEFDDSKPYADWALCSKCREWKEAKEAGDATRVKKHLRVETCKGQT